MEIVELTMRIPAQLYNIVKQCAKADGRTVKDWLFREINNIADRAVNRAENLPGVCCGCDELNDDLVRN